MTDEPIISTRDRPGDYDAFETAKPGEPILTLQGGDPFAPPTVLHWVKLFRDAALNEPDPAKRDAMLRKATSAEAVAWAMQAYQRDERPEEHRQAIEADIAAVNANDRTARLARLADRLYNAIAEANDVSEALKAMTANADQVIAMVLISAAMDALTKAASCFEPRRHLQRERADA